MKRFSFLLLLSSVFLYSCSLERVSDGSRLFNDGWKFTICQGTAFLDTPETVFEDSDSLDVPYGCALPLAEDGKSLLARSEGPKDSLILAMPDFNDSGWRTLKLPHDWSVEGDFNRKNPATTNGGALPGGIGWYRKSFIADKSLRGRCLYIDFDGVYMNSTVWINGVELGNRPYGYISFSYDLTPYLRIGRKNVIAVRVDNSDQPNSRWYSGCGIYRNVHLRCVDRTHIAQWGVFARQQSKGALTVTTTIENAETGNTCLRTELMDREGHIVAFSESQADTSGICEQRLPIEDAHKWSVDNPYLYNLKSTLKIGGRTVDSRSTPVGIRDISFDPKEGFFLNGQKIKINGVCNHHDLGALGSAVNKSALRRQLTILKEMGVNSIRCSHNPPSQELLDLCDEMGLLVMDEAFDMWRQRKTERDYARFFEEWHERDLADLVIRDRNHPSVIMWSIGNEVLEQWSNASADTLTIEEANYILNFGHSSDQLASEQQMSVNSLLTAKLALLVKRLDPTRPVTSGCNEPDPGNHLFRSGALDIIGYNYHDTWFKDVPSNFQGKPFIVSESVSALMTRGYYDLDSDEEKICPPVWSDPHAEPSFACSAFDLHHVPWGTTHEHTLSLVEHNDFIGGQYIWTGFDYLGEPIPYGWPARSSYFGIIDLAGFPKDVYYMYQSVWRDDINVLHLFPHWNWENGQVVNMWAYYNNADLVELFVNGVSMGVRSKLAPGETAESGNNLSTEYHCCWKVPFSAGEVRLVSYKGGDIVAEKTIRTAGDAAALRLTADRQEISADGCDISFVTVEVTDADGNLCPWADNDIHFRLTGPAEIAGVDNGSPVSLERFKANHRKAFYGKCLVMVRSTGKKGLVQVEAFTADNRLLGSTTIDCI